MESKKIVPPYRFEGYEETGSYTDEDDADRKVLDQLVETGCDLTKERHSIHYFYFPSEAGALSAGRELEQMNFAVHVGAVLDTEPPLRHWPVTAERTEVINVFVISELRQPLRDIAERNGGEYDGWEAAAVD